MTSLDKEVSDFVKKLFCVSPKEPKMKLGNQRSN